MKKILEFLNDPGAVAAKSRKAKGLKQREVADKSNLSYDIISRVEHNKRDFKMSTYRKIFSAIEAEGEEK